MATRDDDVASEAIVASEASNRGMIERIVLSGQVCQRGQRRRGRPSLSMMVKDGEAAVVVIVGKLGGRWSSELACSAGPCVELAKRVQALGIECGGGGSVANDGYVVEGLAVIRKWHFVETSASNPDTYALMRANIALHRKRNGQRFLEHAVLASAVLQLEYRNAIQVPD